MSERDFVAQIAAISVKRVAFFGSIAKKVVSFISLFGSRKGNEFTHGRSSFPAESPSKTVQSSISSVNKEGSPCA
jgi:hypothetical protein